MGLQGSRTTSPPLIIADYSYPLTAILIRIIVLINSTCGHDDTMDARKEIITRIMNHKANAIIKRGSTVCAAERMKTRVRDGTLQRLVKAARDETVARERRRRVLVTRRTEFTGELRGKTVHGVFSNERTTPRRKARAHPYAPRTPERWAESEYSSSPSSGGWSSPGGINVVEELCYQSAGCVCSACSADAMFEKYIDLTQCR